MNPLHRARAFSRNLDYRITLACGCTVKTRDRPVHPRQTYGCTTGLAHGYTLAWTAYHDSSGTTTNNEDQQ